MPGFGNGWRSYEEVANIFNETFPNGPPISKSSVFRTVNRFEQTSLVKDKPRFVKPKTAIKSI